jgi:hypothetical protein
MYWIYFIIFILAVLVPDIITRNFLFLTENRLEELLIFFMGAIGFLIFLIKDRQISIQEKEKTKKEKELVIAARNLIESYTYIGEVNRKMDILMSVALGLTDRSELDKKKEKEIYDSIIQAASTLMKAKHTGLIFFNLKSGKIEQEIRLKGKSLSRLAEEKDLLGFKDNVNIKKNGSCLIVCSGSQSEDLRGCLVVCECDPTQEDSASNQEILKFLASQAFSLYCYVKKC